MKRITIFADDALMNEMKELACEESRSVAEIVREALVEYVSKKRHKKRELSFIGIGTSGRSDISRRHEGLLWRKPAR